MQSFPIHFLYNLLMDFYHNEEIVKNQKKTLEAYLKEGKCIKRDFYHRFVIT